MIDKRKRQVYKDFGNNLKRIRRAKKMSLRKLAAATGIDHSHIVKLEDGNYNPTLFTMILLAESLEVPLSDLLQGIR